MVFGTCEYQNCSKYSSAKLVIDSKPQHIYLRVISIELWPANLDTNTISLQRRYRFVQKLRLDVCELIASYFLPVQKSPLRYN